MPTTMSPPPASSGSTGGGAESRSTEIDVARGGLVVIMLVYHCVLPNSCPELEGIKTSIAFIHTAFLMMAGFLCGWHYLPHARANPFHVSWRLMSRGLKVIAIFVIANAALYAVGFHSVKVLMTECGNGMELVDNVVYSVNGHLFTFEILAYIGYFLILASVAILRVELFFVVSVGIVALAGISPAATLYYVGCGFVGVLTAMMSREFSATAPSVRRSAHACAVPVLLALQVYGTFNWPHGVSPLSWMAIRWMETLAWIVCFVLMYRLLQKTPAAQLLPLFGRYSLFSYLGQMLIIVILSRVIAPMWDYNGSYLGYAAFWLTATTGTYCLVFACDRLRKARPFVDSVYRAVFS